MDMALTELAAGGARGAFGFPSPELLIVDLEDLGRLGFLGSIASVIAVVGSLLGFSALSKRRRERLNILGLVSSWEAAGFLLALAVGRLFLLAARSMFDSKPSSRSLA